MKILDAVFRMRPGLAAGICLCGAVLSPTDSRALDLYNLDFTAPDTGTYQVMAGNPVVQSSVGTFYDALVFAAASGGEQIRLPIGVSAPIYELQCDVLTQNLANSDYSFAVYFGTAAVRTLNFGGGLNGIYVYQSSPFLNLPVASLTNNLVYHLYFMFDVQNSVWSVAINGNPLFSGPLNGSALQDIRFGLAPWIGGAANAPNTQVALDNVVVSAVPEPTTAGLAVAGILSWFKLQRRNVQTRK